MSDHMLDAAQAIARLTTDNCRLVDEREGWKKRAEALATALESAAQRMAVDRRSLIEERDAACADLERMRVECEGLRADLLAHPPQRIDLQQYANLKAEHELQVIMIETLREALQRTESMLEESQGKGATLMRGAESDHQIILGLREALERTDKRLSQAKARQIPPALVGLLGVIRREAAAAEKMIL